MIALLILFVLCVLIFFQTDEPQVLKNIKEKYRILREDLKNHEDESIRIVSRQVPVVAYYKMKSTVGYNSNKGQEIGICLDGDENDIFHVLIHELAHCTVEEYNHSKRFWNNYRIIRDRAVRLGIYDYINEKKPFCGKHVQDKNVSM